MLRIGMRDGWVGGAGGAAAACEAETASADLGQQGKPPFLLSMSQSYAAHCAWRRPHCGGAGASGSASGRQRFLCLDRSPVRSFSPHPSLRAQIRAFERSMEVRPMLR